MNLSPNHRRSLSVTARTIEETIEQIERLLGSTSPPNLMREIRQSYSPEERDHILSVLRVLRGANESMIRELNLSPQEIDERQIIHSALARMWVILSDSSSAKMEGFGTMETDAAEVVDRHINNMLKIIRSVSEQ